MKQAAGATLDCQIAGIGAWGPGFSTWPELQALLQKMASGHADTELSAASPSDASLPKPAIIPANELRRAPQSARIAVEVALQAITAAAMPPTGMACVFGSGYGETTTTDYLCSVLNTAEKLISPTRFHNSVHNAPAGYWTISSGCTGSANSVAGFDFTASLALLDAVTHCVAEQEPVLLAVFETPVPAPFFSLFSNPDLCGFAILLLPDSVACSQPTIKLIVDSHLREGLPTWPALPLSGALARLYQHAPAARLLALLSQTTVRTDGVVLPINAHMGLHCTLASY
jgi:hypothetical protein